MTNEVYKDIEIAKQMVLKGISKGYEGFDDKSGIYRGTTENISEIEYQNALKNKKRILSVIASGDQIINSILLGSTDIECFDISRFPKYFLMLKLAAIKSLSKKQYLSFFFDDNRCKSTRVFDERLYSKLYRNLEKEYQIFWDSLFSNFDGEIIKKSKLFINNSGYSHLMSKNTMCYKNPYLDDDNYKVLRHKLDEVSLKFYLGNIFELINGDMEGFDLVNLSNIIEFQEDDPKFLKFKRFIESIPLADDGIVLSYLQTYYYNYSSNELDCFGENYQKIIFNYKPFSDGLLIYKKRKNKIS